MGSLFAQVLSLWKSRDRQIISTLKKNLLGVRMPGICTFWTHNVCGFDKFNLGVLLPVYLQTCPTKSELRWSSLQWCRTLCFHLAATGRYGNSKQLPPDQLHLLMYNRECSSHRQYYFTRTRMKLRGIKDHVDSWSLLTRENEPRKLQIGQGNKKRNF